MTRLRPGRVVGGWCAEAGLIGNSEPNDIPSAVALNAYLICGTPRTGSTMLCGLLRSTDVAGRPESYFRLPDDQTWANRWGLARDQAENFDHGDYVPAAIRVGSSPNGVFGASSACAHALCLRGRRLDEAECRGASVPEPFPGRTWRRRVSRRSRHLFGRTAARQSYRLF